MTCRSQEFHFSFAQQQCGQEGKLSRLLRLHTGPGSAVESCQTFRLMNIGHRSSLCRTSNTCLCRTHICIIKLLWQTHTVYVYAVYIVAISRAGHFRYFLTFSIIKKDFIAFFIKLITYFCTIPI